MAKRLSALLGFALLATFSAQSQQAATSHVVPSHVVPMSTFKRDHRFVTVSGDPTKPGGLYMIRIHSEAGYVIMPHTHPEDEHITVLKGTWEVGMGERYNPNALEPMEMGGYSLVGKKMAHFAFSKTDAVVQVHGIGPFTTTWVTPNYELTETGVLLSTSANLPGTPTSTFPPDCFALKLGARARGKLGEGVVIRAQCTPGQLTQYRIQKANGELFWIQQPALTTP